MSGEDRRAETPQGPPWAVNVLADLHGDALDEEVAEALRPRVEADPDAAAVLSALEATRGELAEQPPLPIPDDVADRIERSLAGEFDSLGEFELPGASDIPVGSRSAGEVVVTAEPSAEPHPDAASEGAGAGVVDIRRAHGSRRRTRRMLSAGAGLIATAAAVVGAVFVIGIPGKNQDSRPGERPQADAGAPSASAPPLALRGGEATVSGDRLASVLSSSQYTDTLSDPRRLIACLRANGVDSGRPLGARRITLNGEPAQLLVLPDGEIGKFRLLAVGPNCGSGNPATLSDTVVGG